MAAASSEVLAGRLRRGLLVTPGAAPERPGFERLTASPPHPDAGSGAAGRAALEMARAGGREVAGLVWLGVAILLFLAVVSYDPDDLSLFCRPPNRPTENLIGPVGAWSAYGAFGALSASGGLALNEGARRGRFFHDTGEGSISRYHREPGGDLVWEIGSGYFGCRDDAGLFNEERFVANAASDQVKMIEVKLSQGASQASPRLDRWHHRKKGCFADSIF